MFSHLKVNIRKTTYNAFAQCAKLRTVKLPSTIRIIDRNAFVKDLGADSSNITLHIPGTAARLVEKNNKYRGLAAVIAAGFMIDGNWYPTLERYAEKAEMEEKARIERERAEQRAREENERRARQRREEEERKQREREALRERVHLLEQERDSLKGLFAGMKRKKIQQQIDELYERIRKI